MILMSSYRFLPTSGVHNPAIGEKGTNSSYGRVLILWATNSNNRSGHKSTKRSNAMCKHGNI